MNIPNFERILLHPEKTQNEKDILHVVYVVVSTIEDSYFEECFLSLLSLRKYNKETFVTIVCDNDTYSGLSSTRKLMLSYADEVYNVYFPETLTNKVKSRLLKTGLRFFIKGDYLFIDCDTIISDNIEQLDYLCQFEMGAVYDGDSPWDESSPIKKHILKHQKTHFELNSLKEYFNSGVVWVKDTPTTHHFYELWQKYYQKGLEHGCDFDQPSFQMANRDLPLIKPLEYKWNLLGALGARYFRKCKIYHNVRSFGWESPHLFKDKVFVKNAAEHIANNSNSENARKAKDIIDDFMNGFTDPVYLTREFLGATEWRQNTAYWFVRNNYHKRSFSIYNFFCKILIKLYKHSPVDA